MWALEPKSQGKESELHHFQGWDLRGKILNFLGHKIVVKIKENNTHRAINDYDGTLTVVMGEHKNTLKKIKFFIS